MNFCQPVFFRLRVPAFFFDEREREAPFFLVAVYDFFFATGERFFMVLFVKALAHVFVESL